MPMNINIGNMREYCLIIIINPLIKYRALFPPQQFVYNFSLKFLIYTHLKQSVFKMFCS